MKPPHWRATIFSCKLCLVRMLFNIRIRFFFSKTRNSEPTRIKPEWCLHIFWILRGNDDMVGPAFQTHSIDCYSQTGPLVMTWWDLLLKCTVMQHLGVLANLPPLVWGIFGLLTKSKWAFLGDRSRSVCGDRMVFSPRLIFTIPIIMHNFSYNPIISYY
jgi:hypothetical protein